MNNRAHEQSSTCAFKQLKDKKNICIIKILLYIYTRIKF